MKVPDLSVGFTQKEVEDILDAQKAELKKVLASYSESGSQVIKRKVDDINKIIAACQHALQKIDPDQYGQLRNVTKGYVANNLAK